MGVHWGSGQTIMSVAEGGVEGEAAPRVPGPEASDGPLESSMRRETISRLAHALRINEHYCRAAVLDYTVGKVGARTLKSSRTGADPVASGTCLCCYAGLRIHFLTLINSHTKIHSPSAQIPINQTQQTSRRSTSVAVVS